MAEMGGITAIRWYRLNPNARSIFKSYGLTLSPSASVAHISVRSVGGGGEGRLGNCPVDSFRPERAEPREAEMQAASSERYGRSTPQWLRHHSVSHRMCCAHTCPNRGAGSEAPASRRRRAYGTTGAVRALPNRRLGMYVDRKSAREQWCAKSRTLQPVSMRLF